MNVDPQSGTVSSETAIVRPSATQTVGGVISMGTIKPTGWKTNATGQLCNPR